MPKSLSTFLQLVTRSSAGFLCLISINCSPSPQVIKGQANFGVVQFPDVFLKKYSGGTKVVTSLHYEVRKVPGPSSGELLFGVDDYDTGYSDNFYAVSPGGEFKVRSSTVEEWNQGVRLPNVTQNYALSGEVFKGLLIDREGVRYRGKLYRTDTGESWTETKAFPSPGGRWIAVFSDTSQPAHRSGIAGLGADGRTSGVMTIDVYDTQSGEKILSGRAPHDGMGGYWFSMSLWVADQFFVIPLDALGKKCFLGRLPE